MSFFYSELTLSNFLPTIMFSMGYIFGCLTIYLIHKRKKK